MLDLLKRIQWDQVYDFLAAGDPPMILRIVALNALFVVFFILRRAKGAKTMQPTALLAVQVMLVVSNMLVMFQADIMRFLNRFI